ncbi:hypothetical protein D3C76_1594290 [compost metagenome]
MSKRLDLSAFVVLHARLQLLIAIKHPRVEFCHVLLHAPLFEQALLFALKGPVGAILHVKVELAAALPDAVTYDFLRVISPT